MSSDSSSFGLIIGLICLARPKLCFRYSDWSIFIACLFFRVRVRVRVSVWVCHNRIEDMQLICHNSDDVADFKMQPNRGKRKSRL